MRFDSLGRIARDARGAAVATVDGTAWFYQREAPTGAWELVRRDGPVVTILDGHGANFWASGGGHWMARLDGYRPLLRGSLSWSPEDGRVGDIDGPWAVTLDSEMVTGTVYYNGDYANVFTRHDPFGGVRVKDGHAAWVEFPGPRVRVIRLSDGMTQPVAVRGDAQYTPVPFLVEGHLWVAYQTDAEGGVCHSADDATQGFRFGDPKAVYDLDVRLTTQGITLGWASDPGQFTTHTRLCPVDQREPLAPPPVEPIPVTLSTAVLTTIREYAAAYPVPHGDPATIEDACRVWTERLCQTVKARHPDGLEGVGGEFGWKRASHDRPLSKETLALQVRDSDGDEVALYGWDLLVGVRTGAPVLADDPAWHDLIAEGPQVFVPVPAVDHLASLPVSDVERPDMSFLAYTSAFDLHLRPEAEQEAWLDAIAPISGVRLVVSSIYRRGSTLTEGREALRRLLPRLATRGVVAEVTLVADTGARGLSRDDLWEHVRQCNEVLLSCPEAVALVCLFNENSHAVEAAYARDPYFLKELDALIDPQFPVAWGANHGGEPVSALLAGGSVIVYHSDRDQTPEANALVMHDAQRRFGKPVVDQEPLGIDEVAIAGKRTDDPFYAKRLALGADGLGGVCLHTEAGLYADPAKLGPVHRDAIAFFADTLSLEPPVTTTDIAKLFAGAFFEAISDLLELSGSVDYRRPFVHTWAVETCAVIDDTYVDIFGRPCDLEGFGSALLLFVDGMSEAEFRAAKQRAFDAGER